MYPAGRQSIGYGMIRYLALSVCACLAVAAARAQEVRHALLIGNEDYPAVVGPLSLPHEDVERIRGALLQQGFPDANITVLKDATQGEINLAVADFATVLAGHGQDAVGFFYYSGHGGSAEANGTRQNFLIPAKTTVTNAVQLPILGVSMNGIIDSLGAADAKAVFIISDACRNTLPLTSSKGGTADKGMVRVPSRSGLYIAFATADGATAPDDGAFSTALANYLAVKGRSANWALREAMRDVARQRPGYQLPFSADSTPSDICFSACSGEGGGPLLANNEQVALGQALSSNSLVVLEEFLRRFPDSHSIGYVEQRIAALRAETPDDHTKVAQARKALVMCQRGEALTCYNAAIYYSTGWGVQKDMVEAARLYRMACEAGSHEGCFNLALDLKNGSGELEPDAAESMRLLQRACDGGLDRACREIRNGG